MTHALTIAHVSDLHFGGGAHPGAAALLTALHDARPDCVVVSGDLTRAARRAEFASAARFLEQLPAPACVVPGNHDLPVWNVLRRGLRPWSRFRCINRGELDSTLLLPGLALIGLNSARRGSLHWNWARGRLSRQQLAGVARLGGHAGLRALALHHPVLRSSSRTSDAAVGGHQGLRAALELHRVDFVFNGHAHHSAARVDGQRWHTLHVQCGTSLGDRLRGEPPAFNLLTIAGDSADLRVMHRDDSGWQCGVSARFERGAAGWHAAATLAHQPPSSGGTCVNHGRQP